MFMFILAEAGNDDWIDIIVRWLIDLPWPVLAILFGLFLVLVGFRVIKLTWINEGKPTWIAGFIFVSFGFALLFHNLNQPTPIKPQEDPLVSTSNPTSTPIKPQEDPSVSTSNPTSTARVQIIEPIDNTFFDNQQGEIDIKVRILKGKKDEYLWIVSNPAGTHHWYPQCSLEDRICSTPIKEDVFLSKYWIKNEKGIHDIHIVSANKSANLAFKNYLSKARATGDWSAEPMPVGASSLTKVRITVE
ncbi:MAG: hypothetical protein ACR9NN_25055 [Nostochopsis sp.]